MWYSYALMMSCEDKQIIPGENIRGKISKFNKYLNNKIFKLSDTARQEEITTYFNTVTGDVQISVGDWVETDTEEIKKLIKKEIKKLYKDIDFKISEPKEVKLNCEFYPTGREWIAIKDWDETALKAEKDYKEEIDKEYGGGS